MAEAPPRIEFLTIETDDADGFLPAVLKGMQAQCGHRRRVAFGSNHAENAAFFEAVAEGVLLIGRCEACGQAHYYPRRHCPHCLAPGAQWQPAAGTGSIYSYTIVASSPDKPRKVVALVELDEGVQVLTNIVDSDEEALRVGARVALVIGQAGR